MYLSKAIRKLKPNSEFSFNNEDYDTVEFYVLEGAKPSQKQIDDAIEQIKADEAQAVIEQALAKAALLDRLSITADEAKLLLS